MEGIQGKGKKRKKVRRKRHRGTGALLEALEYLALDNPDSIARDMPERDCDEDVDSWKKRSVIQTRGSGFKNLPIKTKPLIQ
jgi:hypothetical protein